MRVGWTLGFMRLEVCLFFHFFFFLENKSGPIRLFLIPSQSEKQVEKNTNKGLRPTWAAQPAW